VRSASVASSIEERGPLPDGPYRPNLEKRLHKGEKCFCSIFNRREGSFTRGLEGLKHVLFSAARECVDDSNVTIALDDCSFYFLSEANIVRLYSKFRIRLADAARCG
jgi:hypothetical protein